MKAVSGAAILLRRLGLQVGGLRGAASGAVPAQPPRATLAHTLRQLADTGFEPTTVIDVGVAYGTPELYAAFPKSRLVLIEALAEWETVLKNIAAERDATYVIVAAGSQVGTVPITVPAVLAWGSTRCLPADALPEDVTWRDIPMTTLDTLQAELSVRPPCILKIDVEGGEADVLAGATRLLADCEAVVIEVTIDVSYWAVHEKMRSAGFVLHDVVGQHYRPYDGALFQADLVFVRDGGRFRRGPYSSPDQADRLKQTAMTLEASNPPST